ncbi:hypothetical protein E4U13_003539 [Claviceps humidiphila]|uniref:Methyltransferase n=1 Tax=Claviceps humidiphila TaxID=1294629 RepID=A0A9P7TWF7_9HYPO|nr:hypothetical protein E4U13_003539 [Claviceps humidiphila]
MASGPSSHSDNRVTAADSPVSSAIHDSTSREEGYSIEYLAFTALKAIEALSAEFGDQTDDACDLSSRLEGDDATTSLDVTAAQAIEAPPADFGGQTDDACDLSSGLKGDNATSSIEVTAVQAIDAPPAEFGGQKDDAYDLSGGLEGADATASLAFTDVEAIQSLPAEFGSPIDDACDISGGLEGDDATASLPFTGFQAIEALPVDFGDHTDDAYDLSGGLESDDGIPFTGFEAIGAQSTEFDAQIDDACDLSSGLERDDFTASPFTAVQAIEAPPAEFGGQTDDTCDLSNGLEGGDATASPFTAMQAIGAPLTEVDGQTDDAFDIPSGLEGEVATVQATEAPSTELGCQTYDAFDLFTELEGDDATTSLAFAAAQARDALLAEFGGQTYDEFDLFSGLDGGETTTSLAPIILPGHTYERGRRYPVFGDIQYPIPIDEMEQDREDMQHTMMMMLMKDKLFLSPIGNHPQNIFDIGTGTGTWAIKVGERYPSATVRGIDIASIQPEMVPPNVSFLVNDCEQEWTERYVDLVHFRFMVIMLRDTSKVLGHAFKSLRPGGWIELQEYEATPMCDDGTMSDDDAVKHLYELVDKSFEKFGLKANLAPQLGTYLEKAGFEDIRCQVMKVPIGPWTKDKTMRIIGQYQKSVIVDGLPFLAGRPFQALGMSDAEIEATIAKTRKGLHDPKVHRYLNYYFWYAQKPQWCRA